IGIVKGYHSRLDKNDRLRRWYLETLAAADVTTRKHIVDAHHIVTGIIKSRTILFVQMTRRLLLFCPLYPANIVFVSLTTKRARERCLLCFLTLIEDVPFVHADFATNKLTIYQILT